jgi:glycosyltransferase involved in cell wall biosynthesis
LRRDVVKKLLWIGDAAVATGFARITHHVLDVLKETWDVSVLGLNYMGDPHGYGYPIYPCWPGRDAFGLGRVKELMDGIKPDLIVIQNDPWNIKEYLDRIKGKVATVGALAVDGKNCKPAEVLNGLDLAIFWTRFGEDQAKRGGFKGKSAVIPLGVDLDLYKASPKLEARKFLGLPEHIHNAFIVGNVNRNQPRKRLDLTVEAFARWVRTYNVNDAYLLLQICPTGDLGYDVKQLKKFYDAEGRQWLIVIEPPIGQGIPEELLPTVYSAFDVQLTTTQGEGWGLTTMEGMACGVPQIVPEWSGLAEWTEDAAVGVKCTTTAVTPNKINVVGGVPEIDGVVRALKYLYESEAHRERFAKKGLALVSRPEFRWRSIGEQYAEALAQVEPRVVIEEMKKVIA